MALVRFLKDYSHPKDNVHIKAGEIYAAEAIGIIESLENVDIEKHKDWFEIIKWKTKKELPGVPAGTVSIHEGIRLSGGARFGFSDNVEFSESFMKKHPDWFESTADETQIINVLQSE